MNCASQREVEINNVLFHLLPDVQAVAKQIIGVSLKTVSFLYYIRADAFNASKQH